ncbi:MAG: sulfurtransferase-like selenium metabolism protein YedF [Desulfatibacillaceae bacterium]
MTNEIDARGMACPQPVLCIKDAIDENAPENVAVLVDNEPASQNVSRFLKSRGYEAGAEKYNGIWRVTGSRTEEAPSPGATPEPVISCHPEAARIMVMCGADRIGRGDDGLGAKLMVNFLKTLPEMGEELWRLVLVNSGVKLATAGSDALDALRELEGSGVSILVCGTCLGHFDLLDQKRVGETTNMLDIVTSMQNATRVVGL